MSIGSRRETPPTSEKGVLQGRLVMIGDCGRIWRKPLQIQGNVDWDDGYTSTRRVLYYCYLFAIGFTPGVAVGYLIWG